jgi:cell division protein ZapA
MTELEVEIYGKKYVLRGDKAEEIKAVAEYVDQRMRELLGKEPRPIDPSKAVALAVNFAEEIFNLQKDAEKTEMEIMERLNGLSQKLSRLEKLVEI